MGNCVTLCKPSCFCTSTKVVRIAEQDGKILEFRTPICVKDILTTFPASSNIGVLENATEPLSPEHELKAGRLYYLLPTSSTLTSPPPGNKDQPGGGIKRIKVLITKKQLQQLVTNQISLEDLLLPDFGVNLPKNRKPKLDSIPEENE